MNRINKFLEQFLILAMIMFLGACSSGGAGESGGTPKPTPTVSPTPTPTSGPQCASTGFCTFAVKFPPINSGNFILNIQPINGTFNGQNITVTMPSAISIFFAVESNLTSVFTTVNPTDVVTVNGESQISGVTLNNFESPVVYVVTTASGESIEYTVTLDLSSESATKAAFVGAADAAINNGFIYMPNMASDFLSEGGNESIGFYTLCQLESSGIVLSSCKGVSMSAAGSGDNATGIAFNSGHAYITTFSQNYILCSSIESDGELSSCQESTPYDSSVKRNALLNDSIGIAFNESYAYITNFESANYTLCSVDQSTGLLTLCNNYTLADNSQLSFPAGIAFNESYAYIANYANESAESAGNSYTVCNVSESNGQLESCATNTINGLNAPAGITFNNNIAYITNHGIDFDGTSYVMCTSINQGILSNCQVITPANTSLYGPAGIVFDNNGMAYIANQGAFSYAQCAVESNGALNCQQYSPY